MIIPRQLLFILFTLALSACQTQQLKVELAVSSSQCDFFGSSIAVVEQLSFLPKVLQSKSKYSFDQNVYIFVAAGQKPSAGYRFEMIGEYASAKGNKVVLPLKLTEPKPGFLQAQVITSPCVILSAKRSEVEAYLNSEVEFVLQGDLEKE